MGQNDGIVYNVNGGNSGEYTPEWRGVGRHTDARGRGREGGRHGGGMETVEGANTSISTLITAANGAICLELVFFRGEGAYAADQPDGAANDRDFPGVDGPAVRRPPRASEPHVHTGTDVK